MPNINVMLYHKKFNKKPENKELWEIQKNLKETTISIKELAENLSKGATFKPAALSGTKSADFISQQIFALDFDDGTTIEEELQRCIDLNIRPCFGYTTFSHTEDNHKFRLVFCNNEVIYNRTERDRLQLALINAFEKSDSCIKDAGRLFFGGRKLICEDYNQVIDGKTIIEKHYDGTDKKTGKAIVKNHKRLNNDSIDFKACSPKYVDAISRLDVDELRLLLKRDFVVTDREKFLLLGTKETPKTVFTSRAELRKHIKNISLYKYLNIPEGTEKFNCILSKHDDFEPSANIYITNDGTPVYKCFGCDKCFTIIGLTEELAGCSRSKAMEFIMNVYDLELQKTEWAENAKGTLIDNANYLYSEEFKIQFPTLNRIISTRKHHLERILLYFSEYVTDELQIDGRPIVFSNYSELMRACGLNPRKRETLSQTLTLFCLLNMLDKLDDADIPEAPLKKARHIAATNLHRKRVSFYSVREYGVELLTESERMAKILLEKHFSFEGLCREYVLRTFGVGTANKIYPQHKFENVKGPDDESDRRTVYLASQIKKDINNKGYCLEKDLYKKNILRNQWKKSTQEILESYGYKKVRVNNDLKKELNIEGKGYPNIIIDDDSDEKK